MTIQALDFSIFLEFGLLASLGHLDFETTCGSGVTVDQDALIIQTYAAVKHHIFSKNDHLNYIEKTSSFYFIKSRLF